MTACPAMGRAKRFGVGIASAVRWVARFKATGEISPAPMGGDRRSLRIEAHSKLKAFLRKMAERTVAGLLAALDACADIFKAAECENYFRACGYEPDGEVNST